MTIDEKAVSQHYSNGELLSRILQGLEASEIDPKQLKPHDLAPVEEFHIGGREATAYAASKMAITPQHHVLDIGCGIGGAARFLADQTGCQATGIDLTEEFIETGKSLNQMTGLEDKVSLATASALDLPFEDNHFDAALTLHAAMNISDRKGLYRETARVLKPGALLCVYDVMKTGDSPLAYPVPWAETAETSHLTTPAEMESLLAEAGFEIREQEDRRDFAIAFFEKSLAAMQDKKPALSLNVVMGGSAPEKFKNMRDNIERGCISPVQMIAVKR